MADRTRSLEAELSVNPRGVVAGLGVAKQQFLDFSRDATAAVNRNRVAIDTVSNSIGKMTVVAGAGLGFAVKSAIDWETAWAGVTKTTNGTAKQMGELEGQLRELAKTMPVTHQEIAATAEAAGQLGVRRQDIAEFTKVMIQLGVSTNLTADEAATAMQQFMNIMGTAPSMVNKLGSTLVALGNNGASTESQILDMGQRIAGAGRIAGLTEANILSLSNAVASTGINAELGGTAMSRVLIKISKDVATNSSNLATWGKTSKMSAQEFANAWRSDPTMAISAFIKGLNTEGQKGFVTLKQLGLGGANTSQTLLNLAGSADKLDASMRLGNRAIKQTSALTNEYEKRNKTAAAEVQKSWNQIKDAMIDVGTTALPVVKELAQAVATLAGGFGKMPEPLQSSAVRMLALVAALGGATWVTMRTARGFADLAQGLNTLIGNSERLTRTQLFRRGGAAGLGLGLASIAPEAHKANDALGILTDAASGAAMGFAFGGNPLSAAVGGVAGGLIGLTAELLHTSDAERTLASDVDAVVATLDKQTGAVTKDTDAWVQNRLAKSGAVDAANKLGVPVADLTAGAQGNKARGRQALETARATINQTQQSMVNAGVAPDVQASVLKPLEAAYGRLERAIGSTSSALAGAKKEFAETAQVAYAQAGAFGQVAAVLGDLFGGAEKYVGVLETIPPEVQTEIGQRGAQSSKAAVDALAKAYNKTPEQIMTALIANDLASGKLRVVDGHLETLDGTVVTPVVNVDIGGALAGAKDANAAINGVRQKRRPKVAVDAKQAIADAQRTKSLLDSLRDKRLKLTIDQYFNSHGSVSTGGFGKGAMNASAFQEADGGVVSYFANGKENHVAQIAGAGSWRVWAEPETGGEAYIPLAESKRGRSLDIWKETGRLLGAFDSGQAQAAADSFRTRDISGTSMRTTTAQSSAAQIAPIVLPPLEARLVDPRLYMDGNGHIRLMDQRVSLGIARQKKYESKR